MDIELIAIIEYCEYSKIELDFINLLKAEQLIEVQLVSGKEFISIEQLPTLEQYARWHYEMEINWQGIDALRNMLDKVKVLQDEINDLQNKLKLYE